MDQIEIYFESLHDLVHRFTGIAYPHGHWWIAIISVLIFIITPTWMAWHVLALARRIAAQRRLKAVDRSPPTRTSLSENKHNPLEWTILRWTLRRQFILLVISSLVIPTTYFLLELPKHIVNHALSPGGPKMDLLGAHVDQITLLFALCGAYLMAITLNGAIKYASNATRGRVNERVVRRLRLAVIKARARQQPADNPAALVSVAISECEPIGYFGGSMVTVPIIQGGTLLTSLAFLWMQDVALALAAVVMLPVQAAILPQLQSRINRRVRSRVHITRSLSSVLAEDVKGREAIRHRQWRVRELEETRVDINRLKARLKAIYTFTANLTPFFLFSVGGYLVLNGELSIGALVAALAAYKEINPSLRELFDFFQAWSDARARYAEVVRALQ